LFCKMLFVNTPVPGPNSTIVRAVDHGTSRMIRSHKKRELGMTLPTRPGADMNRRKKTRISDTERTS
jgi:hypothetical protein